MTKIKNLVLSGGGHSVFQIIGAISHLTTTGYLELSQIKCVYGTSAGGIIGALLSLKYDWNDIVSYSVNRQWNDLFKIKVENIFEAYKKKGIYDKSYIEKGFKPLLYAKNLSLNITLKELYEYSDVDLHMYSIELNSFKVIDISHTTHPELELLTAIQMTCGLPLLVTPVFLDGKIYIDGGILSNYPINYCDKPSEETLGFVNSYVDSQFNITEESNIVEYIFSLLSKIIQNLRQSILSKNSTVLENELKLETNYLTVDTLNHAIGSVDGRLELLKSGISCAKKYLENKT